MLQLIYAPNPIFRKKALPVEKVDNEICQLIDQMFELLAIEHGIGLGANMVGILKRIIVVKMYQDDVLHRYAMINPTITNASEELHTAEEASLSFPGIAAMVTRPRQITVEYLDEKGVKQSVEATDLLATVIQHEIDYLDGKIFLDYLSKMKQDMLLKKMKKHLKQFPPHVHGPHCSH